MLIVLILWMKTACWNRIFYLDDAFGFSVGIVGCQESCCCELKWHFWSICYHYLWCRKALQVIIFMLLLFWNCWIWLLDFKWDFSSWIECDCCIFIMWAVRWFLVQGIPGGERSSIFSLISFLSRYLWCYRDAIILATIWLHIQILSYCYNLLRSLRESERSLRENQSTLTTLGGSHCDHSIPPLANIVLFSFPFQVFPHPLSNG